MLLMQQRQEGILLRLTTIGIPKQLIHPFLDELVKWETHSGADWTIKRLKSLKVDLIRRRSLLPPLTWVRKNSKGDVAGVIGSLFRWSDLSDRNFRRCVQAFMAYTFYVFPTLTQGQKEKFLGAVTCDRPDGLSVDFHRGFTRSIRTLFRNVRIGLPSIPLLGYGGSPEKRAPVLFQEKSVAQDTHILRDLDLFTTFGGIYLYRKYKRIYSPLLSGLGMKVRLDITEEAQRGLPLESNVDHLGIIGGKICFLQEPGGKLRPIASPLRVHQEALRPLGQCIYRMVSSLPWDCTFDQMKAVPFIQSRLANGGQVHSVDLSSATDMFPLSLQITALSAIIHCDDQDHISLFEDISRSTWYSPLGKLRWKRGQPLGLYPSFGCFTLTHGLLLRYLNGGHDNAFFIVGDDVVILKNSLKDAYLAILDQMSCPWSMEKSLSSNRLAEFAGKIITSEWVIPQMKWRQLSDDNFLDLCRELGQRSRVLLTARQRRVFDRVKHLVSPIGLNMSYPGSNLERMIEDTLSFWQPERAVLGSLMSLRGRIHRFICEDPTHDLDSEAIMKLCATFDEKVVSVIEKTIFGRLWTAVDALSSIPRDLGITDLPLKVRQPSRVSTLQRYERLMLGHG